MDPNEEDEVASETAMAPPGSATRATRSSPEATFETLFHQHYADVYRLLFRMTGTREEAEDLAQETFLRLHRAPHLWHGAQNVRGWLYRVAVNLTYNAARGRSRRAQARATRLRPAARDGSPRARSG